MAPCTSCAVAESGPVEFGDCRYEKADANHHDDHVDDHGQRVGVV
jgi:hypothetical protein